MRDDLLATVCRRSVHGPKMKGRTGTDDMCPVWCDAAWRATSQFGSQHDPPIEARDAYTVPWDHLQVTGEVTMVAPPVPMVDTRPTIGQRVKEIGLEFGRAQVAHSFPSLAAQPITNLVNRERMEVEAQMGVRALLALMGEDPDREGLVDTPKRVVKAYLEMASRPGDPAELLSRVFGDVGQSSEMICVPGIRFVSLCEHHLLPFTGTAAVAYIPQPGGSVVGLSKIPRLVHHWAMRPQVQERLTRQIADSLESGLTPGGMVDDPMPDSGPLGVAVRIDSTHSCMSLRGVKADAASMVTTDLRGRFLEGAARAEFLAEAMR